MKTLLLLRGTPGSGKSTLIAKTNIRQFTVCPDDIRLIFQSPCIDEETGKPYISQKNDKRVWKFVNDRVEEKMQKGEFIVIDAMNINPDQWRCLAEKYRYSVFVYNMPGTLETFLKWNKNRETYKQVPDDVIKNAYDKIQNTPVPKWCHIVDDMLLFMQIHAVDYSRYSKIVLFGDIHGCMEPIDRYFQFHPYDKNALYIFLGDYLDRGIQNKEVLEYFIKFSENENVIFLEGNHAWERYWANGEMDKIKSDEFLANTLPQIESIEKSKVRNFCRKWRQMVYFTYNDKTYFVTHAGFSLMPDSLLKTPSYDMTRGSKYSTDVDKNWNNWCRGLEKEHQIIQIHGHRNLYQYAADEFEYSINLNDYVEFGKPLRVYEITPFENKVYLMENKTFSSKPNPWGNRIEKFNTSELTDGQKFLLSLRKSGDILEKDLGHGISSFNFKRDVFFSGRWNALNKVARGLFLDNVTGDVVARSYPKFFNYCEKDKNTDDFLKENLKFPVTAYRKYNGFLGILSVHDNQFFMASKSTDSSDFAGWFREIFNKTVSDVNKAKILKYLKDEKSTMVFEVIDPVNDPHIIEYDKSQIVLLDIIKNTEQYEKKSYSALYLIAQQFGLEVKQVEFLACDFDSMKKYFTSVLLPDDGPIEGYVIEDKNGYMFKYKTDFYNEWKKRRMLKERYSKYLVQNPDMLSDNEDAEFVKWMMANYSQTECQEKSIIQLRNEYEEYKNKKNFRG